MRNYVTGQRARDRNEQSVVRGLVLLESVAIDSLAVGWLGRHAAGTA